MVKFRILRALRRAKSKLTALDFRRVGLTSSKIRLEESREIKPWRKEGHEMLVNAQRSLSARSREVHPSEKGVRQNARKPTWMNKEPLSKLKHRKKNTKSGSKGE